MSRDNGVNWNVNKRYIRLNDYINFETTADILTALFDMEEDKHKDDIDFYINCYGGYAHDVFAIYDVIRNMESKVNTIGLGKCMSGGAMLLIAGTGKRKAYPNIRIMLHGMRSGLPYRSFEENRSLYKEDEKLQEMIFKYISDYSNLSLEEVKEIMMRDKYMSAKESLEYNFIDEIIGG